MEAVRTSRSAAWAVGPAPLCQKHVELTHSGEAVKAGGVVRTQPLVSILTTGGTIASRRFADGARPALAAEELVAGSAEAGVELRTREVLHLDSSSLLPEDLDAARSAVVAELEDPSVTGVVLTHGTDTMEETAMLIDLMHADPRPVIMTGAQRPADSPDADGPANLSAAIAAAVDPLSRGRGVLIAMGGTLVPARGTAKFDSAADAPFATVRADLPRPLLTPTSIAGTRVDIVMLYPGVDPSIIGWCAGAGASGIVLVATGSGNTHPRVVDAVADAIGRGVVVVVCSRVPRGEIVATYGGGGGAVDLAARGAIISPWLRGPQARMALQALLAGGAGHADVAEFFAAE
ncbi:L-asparaginase [Williamsia muralis]|uniref:asparaginase n=1 Tax=Williamsia marianensis TaxID=85044 RepID=A0A495K2X1_WILMA|nr:L-asparaginase [Williamsia muralis]